MAERIGAGEPRAALVLPGSGMMNGERSKDGSDGAPERDHEGEVRDANAMIASGIGVGALGAAAAVIGGAVCPVCIVAVPALVGAGAYKRWRACRSRR